MAVGSKSGARRFLSLSRHGFTSSAAQDEEAFLASADLVDKFQRDTGISAQLVSESEDIPLPPAVAREVLQIVAEALANVRKHSAASNVGIRFSCQKGRWRLVIEDDGRGFDFSGRRSQAELDAARQGPAVIKERVRSLGGELAIESTPGRGARLEVSFSQNPE